MKRTIEIHRVARRNGVKRVQYSTLEVDVFEGSQPRVRERAGTPNQSGGSNQGHGGGRKRKHK